MTAKSSESIFNLIIHVMNGNFHVIRQFHIGSKFVRQILQIGYNLWIFIINEQFAPGQQFLFKRIWNMHGEFLRHETDNDYGNYYDCKNSTQQYEKLLERMFLAGINPFRYFGVGVVHD